MVQKLKLRPRPTDIHRATDSPPPSLPRSPIDPVCLYASLHALIPSFPPSVHPSLPYKRRTRRSCLLAIHPPSSFLLARRLGGGTAKPKAACQATSRRGGREGQIRVGRTDGDAATDARKIRDPTTATDRPTIHLMSQEGPKDRARAAFMGQSFRKWSHSKQKTALFKDIQVRKC